MTKTAMLSRLKRIKRGECRTRGLYPLIQFLIHYFGDSNIPEYEHSGIYHFLPMYIARAVDLFRTSNDPKAVEYRAEYNKEMERDTEIPSLTEIEFGGINRALLNQTLSMSLAKFLEGGNSAWLEKTLEGYFTAQDTVVMQMIHRFDAEVYQSGLFEVIQKCTASGMSGTFGQTSLRSMVTAGRVMFTLARRIEGETVYRDQEGKEIERLPYREVSVSFVGQDGKEYKYEARFGIQSMHTDLATTLSLFSDVFANWPKEVKEQKKVYKADKAVGMI